MSPHVSFINPTYSSPRVPIKKNPNIIMIQVDSSRAQSFTSLLIDLRHKQGFLLEGIAPLRHWYLNPNKNSNKSIELIYQSHNRAIPLRKCSFKVLANLQHTSWQRSSFNEVNDWAPSVLIWHNSIIHIKANKPNSKMVNSLTNMRKMSIFFTMIYFSHHIWKYFQNMW